MSEQARVIRGRYRLVRAISRNRASTTWEAVDEESGGRCVVKELSVGAALSGEDGTASFDPDDFTKVVELFEREARVLAHLDHPGIPRLVDHFELEAEGETRLFTVQELVEGATLDDLVRDGRHFTEKEAMRICRELAVILGHLHGRSPPLIHRDVKPGNVILSGDAAVHLVDFGSVRTSIGGRDGKTIVGTYGYMPMEQYEGRAVPQSDFYALGMTLLYVLSHRDPTEIPRTGLALDFRSYVHVSERFARLIGWLIAPAPEDRPPDAAAILDALDPQRLSLPDLLPAVEPATARRGVITVAARRRVALLLGILGVLAGLWGFFGGGLWFTSDESAAPVPVPVAEPAPPRRPEPDVPVPAAVRVSGGVLSIDLDRDFVYVPRGWPMGRAVGQTSFPSPARAEPAGVRLPDLRAYRRVYFGVLPMGNAEASFDYALVEKDGSWSLFFDSDDDGSLDDEGPPRPNGGTGPLFAGLVSMDVDVRLEDGTVAVRPYQLWIWFTETSGGTPMARGYARQHYRGRVRLDGETHEATVFEFDRHDALYRDAGVCIDLSGDARCDEETELFFDGDVVRAGSDEVRLRLTYP